MSLPAYDPHRYIEYQPGHRTALYRKLLVFVPAGLFFTGLLAIAILNLPGTIVGVVILGICAFALDVEAVQATRDVLAQPRETIAPIDKIWSKSRFLWMGRVNYMIAGGRLFEVGPPAMIELRAGDVVRILHWPHTNVILTLERTSEAEAGL
jgi:hypothetical protein